MATAILVLQGFANEDLANIDAAMWRTFEIYPTASFSDWKEDKEAVWMNILFNGGIVGRIIEVE